MENLPITQQSPEIALFFGLAAIATGALLLAVPGGSSIPQVVLLIFSIFWTVTGIIALWFGYKYFRMRQQQ
ncbi:MAG: hypothetical protein ABIH83_02030 [Candidatus Micrarchaeota archaeon]